MKKALLLIAVCFLAITTSSSAQAKFGLKAGLNIANMGGDDAGDLDSKTGLVIGGFMMYQFSDMFAFQPEVLFSMKGAAQEIQNVDLTISMNYIEIPLLVKFLIPVQGSNTVTPAIYAGPALALNVSANAKMEAGDNSQEQDISDNVKTLDFGLAFGASLGFAVGPTNELGLDFRYTLGLTDWPDAGGQDANITNNAVSIAAYFAF